MEHGDGNGRAHGARHDRFELEADFRPSGDQAPAVTALVDGLGSGLAHQTLLGVTGSGKTFTIANVVSAVQRPTLVLAPNKTLAAQLYGEMREFFPRNAVEYFVSYYDYYQPEAYIPSTDTYIEKDASINEHVEQMRLSATKALLERADTVIVATVSAIYGLGDPERFHAMVLHLVRGGRIDQRELLRRLTELQYTRTSLELRRGTYRVRGDVIDVYPAESERESIRIELFDDEIEALSRFDPLTGEVSGAIPRYTIYPKNHYVTPRDTVVDAIDEIREELAGAAARAQVRAEAGGGAAPGAAHPLRPRDAPGDRPLQGDRELLPLPFRPGAGRAAAHPVRLPPGRVPARHRREPRDGAPARGDVPGRPVAEGDPGALRVPPSVGARQPAASLRRVRAHLAPDGVRVGHSGPLRTRAFRGRGGAARAADGARGPGGGGPPRDHPGGRRARRDQPPRRGGRAGARHRADQAHGRGPHRVPRGARGAGALPPLGHRHGRAGRDHPGPSSRRIRRPRRHQPPPGRARHAGGLPRRDPRCRQGGVSALRALAHPDHRTGGAQHQRHRHPVRRCADRLHEARDRRDRPPPRAPGRLQPGARRHPARHPQGGDGHHGGRAPRAGREPPEVRGGGERLRPGRRPRAGRPRRAHRGPRAPDVQARRRSRVRGGGADPGPDPAAPVRWVSG